MDALQGQLEKGAKVLQDGGIIAYPTDTVYGLGADVSKREAVERIYEVKKRSRQLSLPLLLADVSQLTVVADSVSEIAWFLTRRFWPGGLTLVLPRAASLPSYLATGSSIAVRVPNHPICLALIRCLGGPIIGTSANISGKPAALTAEEVEQQLGGKVDFIIDGGKCPGGRESTVVDVTHDVPVILRRGIIAADEIEGAYKEYLEVDSNAHCSRM